MNVGKRLSGVVCRSAVAVQANVVGRVGQSNCAQTLLVRQFQSTSARTSKVTQNSWASERLLEIGEKLEEGEKIPPTQLSDEALYNPSPKVLKLADELLACNMVESNQVWRAIQVRNLHFTSCIPCSLSSNNSHLRFISATVGLLDGGLIFRRG